MMDGWGHGIFGGIWMILLWGAIIALPVLLIWLAVGGSGAPRPTPREILEERYARGEIDSDEFEQRKRDLDES